MRAIVGRCSSLRASFDDRIHITTNTIFNAVRGYLHFKAYKFAGIFAYQCEGIPIGGYLSSVLLNLSIGTCEDYYDKHVWPKPAMQHGLSAVRATRIAMVRYEDDVLTMSKSKCGKCLCIIVQSTYRNGVVFDRCSDFHQQADNYTCNKFLDMYVVCTDGVLHFDTYKYNQTFVDTGNIDTIVKYRYPVPIGPDVVDKLAVIFCSRRARWRQLHMDKTTLCRNIIYETLELKRLGYTKTQILKAWISSRRYDVYHMFGIYTIMQAFDLIQSPRPNFVLSTAFQKRSLFVFAATQY